MYLAELRNPYQLYIVITTWIKTQPDPLVAEYKSAFCRQAATAQGFAAFRAGGEQPVPALSQNLVAIVEAAVIMCRDPLEGSPGRSRIEIVDTDQVYFPHAEGVGTSEYFAHIELGLEVIQDDNPGMGPWCGQLVEQSLPVIVLTGQLPFPDEAAGQFFQTSSHVVTESYVNLKADPV